MAFLSRATHHLRRTVFQTVAKKSQLAPAAAQTLSATGVDDVLFGLNEDQIQVSTTLTLPTTLHNYNNISLVSKKLPVPNNIFDRT